MAVILRCERNEAERVVDGDHYADLLADCCTCHGSHTVRPTSVIWAPATVIRTPKAVQV